VFAQPELPLVGVDALSAKERVELWLSTGQKDDRDPEVVTARLYLHDADTRAQRARRWVRVREIYERNTNDWGVLAHGGPETVWLLEEAARALIEGVWLASLLCSHAACERHLAGMLAMVEDALPAGWRFWGLGRLLEAAQQRDMLPAHLVEPLGTLNAVRKSSAHFKPPLHEGALLNRAHNSGQPDLLQSALALAEEDAFSAYETARGLVHQARA